MAQESYSATGYGATPQEAEINARDSILSDQATDEAMGSAFTGTTMMLLAIFGYAYLAFKLAVSFFFRPLPAMIVAGLIGGIGYYWFSSAAEGGHSEAGSVFSVLFYIVVLSPLAAFLGTKVPQWVMLIETMEARLVRRLPDALRVPVTIAILISPVVAYAVWVEWYFSGRGSIPYFTAVMKTFTSEVYFVGWYVLVATIAAGVARACVHPLAEEFTWWGAPIPPEKREIVMDAGDGTSET